jgi:uncharacterized protein YacL
MDQVFNTLNSMRKKDSASGGMGASGASGGGGAPPPNLLEQEQRDRSVLLKFLRLAFFVMMVTVALLLIFQQQSESNSQEQTPQPRLTPSTTPAGSARTPDDGGRSTTSTHFVPPPGRISLAINFWPMLGAAVAFFILVVLVDLMTPDKKIAAISGVFLGMVTGILATIALAFVIDLVVRTWIPDENVYESLRPLMATIKVMLGISLCYLSISTVLQTQDQFRLVIPYVEFSKQMRGSRPNLVDTSALIDARIADLAATGLVQSALIVPRFVIAELQLLADSGDRLKRGRGRRGLDIVTRMQRGGMAEIIIDETPVTAIGVDQMLVELAEKLGARIITTDLGLARVAQIKGITAINLHDLANSLRPALVPGEQINIRLVKGGEQAGQGVGYLDDGTMVVAEGGAPHIGEEVALLVTSTMQTTAGRLVFARPANAIVDDEDDAAGDSPAPPAAAARAAEVSAAVEATHVGSSRADDSGIAEPEKPSAIPPAPAPRPGPLGPNRGGGPRRTPTPRNPRRMGGPGAE